MYRFIIGRNAACDFKISEPTVSSKHACIEIDTNGFAYVEDLASRNGTYVNAKAISARTRLKPGDKLELGNVVFDWEAALTGNAAAPAPEFPQQPSDNQIIPENKNGRWLWAGALAVFVAFVFWVVATPGGRESVGKAVGIDSASREEKKQKKKKRTYNIACLNNGSAADAAIRKGNEIENRMLRNNKVSVTREQEIKIGDALHQQVLEEYKLEKDKAFEKRVERVFRKLIRHLPDSNRGFNYVTYVLTSDEINAFTAGGKIYITTGILNFMKSDDELACVIGHEIFHNELGHINRHLRKEAILKKMFGDILGQVALMAGSIFTASFNQDEEAYCDLYGLDMAHDAGYAGCAIRDFWKRMAEKEDAAEAGKFFRTHPYATQRAHCIENHIKTNYNHNCNERR